MASQDTISGQEFITKKEPTMLIRALQANALFSGLCGLIAIAFSMQVATFLGLTNSTVILIMGIGLLLWAGFTAWVLMRPVINPTTVKLIIEGDLLWVVGTILLLIFAGGIFTTGGKWAMAIVGDIVAVFAILQWVGLRRMQRA